MGTVQSRIRKLMHVIRLLLTAMVGQPGARRMVGGIGRLMPLEGIERERGSERVQGGERRWRLFGS
jgi:hypothetical protein